MRFTDKAIASLKPQKGRYEAWDKHRPAFGIRVGESGKKSWFFVYHNNRKARRLTLGRYPQMSLADAGVAYAEARRALEHGNDPGASTVEKRQRLRATPTVRELGEEYLEKHDLREYNARLLGLCARPVRWQAARLRNGFSGWRQLC